MTQKDNSKRGGRRRNTNEYHTIPTRYPKHRHVLKGEKYEWESTRPQPEGWVYLNGHLEVKEVQGEDGRTHREYIRHPGILGPVRRRMTEGYLNTRMNRMNTIETNQNYVSRVMENPRTPEENRRAVIQYVKSHPQKFIRLADMPEDPEYQSWADRRNGNAKRGFLRDFLRKYDRGDAE